MDFPISTSDKDHVNAPLTFLTRLECSVCRTPHPAAEIQTVCRKCGKALLARYDLASARRTFTREGMKEGEYSMWRYAPVLPVGEQRNIVSLGERVTPLIPLRTMFSNFSAGKVLMKDEGLLPTGSFKARGLAMAISRAKELGISSICLPSAGNAGGAAAAYASRAGMHSWIYMPKDTPEINIEECIAYGAHITLVQGNISDAAKAMNEERKKHPEWFDVSTLKEPYRLEGKKTMAYELAEQLGWKLPDWIVYPTGGGTGLIGMWKGFEEMEELGWIGRERPKMVSVQAAGCAPIARAFVAHRGDSEFWEHAETIASGLRVPKAFADHLILTAIYASGGVALSVSDEEIRAAVSEIAKKEGLFISPEGAATVAALAHLAEERLTKETDLVVLFNTATGLKYPELIGDPRP